MQHPVKLALYTPGGLKRAIEAGGGIVKPLQKGSLKGVPFEDGGGFKTNFEDGGILQYHPERGSHHGGEYYKISTGEKRTKRYDRNGIEIKEDKR